MVGWLGLVARHWFLLPPAVLLLAVAALIALAAQESTPTPWAAGQACRWGEPLRDRDRAFVCVLVVLDQSLTGAQGFSMDRRQRLRRFVADAVSRRARERPRDLVGLVVLGPPARLVLRPMPVGAFLFPDNLPELEQAVPDLGAGLRLALDALPRDCGRRILLLSDGADSQGSARQVAREARTQRVPIDVVLPPGPDEADATSQEIPGVGRSSPPSTWPIPRAPFWVVPPRSSGPAHGRQTDLALLEEVRALTNGRAYADADLAEVVTNGLLFRPGVPRSGTEE